MPQNTVSNRSGHGIDRLTGTNNTAAVTDKYNYRLTSLLQILHPHEKNCLLPSQLNPSDYHGSHGRVETDNRFLAFFLITYCTCRALLLHVLTLNDTDTHSKDCPRRGTSPSRKLLPDNEHSKEKQTSMTPPGLEPGIPASERPHRHLLDRAATGSGYKRFPVCLKLRRTQKFQHDATNCYFRSEPTCEKTKELRGNSKAPHREGPVHAGF